VTPRNTFALGSLLLTLCLVGLDDARAAGVPEVLPGAATAPDAVMAALSDTLQSVADQTHGNPDAPYFTALGLTDEDTLVLGGVQGTWGGDQRTHSRTGDVDLRVGSMKLDNTHKLRDAGWFEGADRPAVQPPLTNDGAVIRAAYLRGLDDAWRSAKRQLIKIRSNDAVKVAREDSSDDYSPAPVSVVHRPVAPLSLDSAAWKRIVVDSSAVYLEFPEVYDSGVQLVAKATQRWLATSEGTRIADGGQHYRIATWGTTVAEDGMELQVYDYLDVASLDHLPDAAAIRAMSRQAAERLVALRHAPVVEPYSGPAILRGRAAGVFFHEIFGHRIEGHRQKDEDEGQTFTSRVNQRILPDFLSVVDDPTVAQRNGIDLNGTYAYDDEGVAAQRVQLVDKGILRNFLMSRAPIENFPASNGHGRRQPGMAVVPRQGNLMVEATRSVPYATLRKMLIEEVKRQNKPFGMIFDDISGGFTFTGRSEPNAFAVQPVVVWRVYADGRSDELVRGVDLIGTPLTTFERILAAGDDVDVFNGVCGAESGWVPVSASSPSLLVGEVEVQRREKANDRPPILPPPGM
jgi:predicted Zn-dependent protease